MADTPAARPLTADDLVDLEELKRLKYRYLRCIDLKRFDDLVDVLTPDCVASYSGGAYHYDGRDAIVAFLRDSMGAETFHSSHRCHHPEIDVTGADTATGVWALDDVVILTDWELTIRGSAYYTDEYVRTPDGWRIHRTGYRRIYEETLPRASVPGLKLTASWWATDGRSELQV